MEERALVPHGYSLTDEDRNELLTTLQARFDTNRKRHPTIRWEAIRVKLMQKDSALLSLLWMERSGGEPDVVDYDPKKDQYLLADCAAETPAGRRNICYDQKARQSRRRNAPTTSAEEEAAAWGIEIVTPAQYRKLQKLGVFDTHTSSWLKTPARIRRLGGALFGDRRFNSVFIYHNGADSYFSDRGFRGILRV